MSYDFEKIMNYKCTTAQRRGIEKKKSSLFLMRENKYKVKKNGMESESEEKKVCLQN
jgi:hypothetical protein